MGSVSLVTVLFLPVLKRCLCRRSAHPGLVTVLFLPVLKPVTYLMISRTSLVTVLFLPVLKPQIIANTVFGRVVIALTFRLPNQPLLSAKTDFGYLSTTRFLCCSILYSIGTSPSDRSVDIAMFRAALKSALSSAPHLRHLK